MDLRICHVNLARGYRGGERQTELLVRELAARGVEQRAIVRKGDELARRLAGVPGNELLPIGRPFMARAGLGRGWLLHAHESKAAHFAHACNRVTGASYLITRRVDNVPSGSFLTRNVYNRASAVVAISTAVRRVLELRFPGLKVRLIPSVQARMASTPARVAAIRAKWPGKLLVGQVGALENSQKGQLYLIRAARRLAATHPAMQFVLVGGGKDEAWLRQEAAGLSNVSFEGYVHDVENYLGAFHVFAFPSLHEGLGSVLLDAMSFGLPIVASAVDGIPDIVQDGENGLLVPQADHLRLAEAIARLYDDSDLRERLARGGRAVAARHTPEVMADAYLQLYGEIGSSRQ